MVKENYLTYFLILEEIPMSRKNRNRRARPVNTLSNNRWPDMKPQKDLRMPQALPDYIDVYSAVPYDPLFDDEEIKMFAEALVSASPQLRVKKLIETAHLPTRGSQHAAGFDLYAANDVTIKPGESILAGTGIAMAIPNGYFGQINPRSGVAYKTKIRIGSRVIDSDYRGEIMVNLHNDGEEDYEFKAGERIAQIVIMQYLASIVEVEELDTTVRGTGGFGSTGK